MEFLRNRALVIVLAVVLVGGFLLYQFWVWEFERVEVPPGHSLIRIHRWGKNLPPGEIIAPDENYKGIMLEPLKEGRHFLNPIFWGHEIHPMVEVSPGTCLVLTRKFGNKIPPERLAKGDILAKGGIEDPKGERGIMAEVLKPGRYRLNKYAFEWEVVPAVEIGANEVGVKTLKVGKDPRLLKVLDAGVPQLAMSPMVQGPWLAMSALAAQESRSPYLVPEGYRGVQQEPVSNGTYYINPHAERIVPVQTRVYKVEFTDISFPTEDGFILKPPVKVTYRVLPEKAPELLVLLTNRGELSQEDETPEQQSKNQILQKVILPLVRGYVRIEGGKFNAHQFIAQEDDDQATPTVNARERLQQELMDKVAPRCRRVGVDISSIAVGNPATYDNVSGDLAKLRSVISDREQARIEKEKNESQIKEAITQKSRAAKEAIEEQKEKVGEAQKLLTVAETEAEAQLEVKEKELKQQLENAQVRLDAAKKEAEAVLAQAKADASVIDEQNQAEVAGLKKAVSGFSSAEVYAQYRMIEKLAPALSEIFTSDQSEFAKLFTKFMSPGVKPPAPKGPAGTTRAAKK